MQTLESLSRKIGGAKELKSIVRTMKAMAAANIGQYEAAVESIGKYYSSVAMGILAYLQDEQIGSLLEMEKLKKNSENSVCAIVFGSDQGFVGQFNDKVIDFLGESFQGRAPIKEVWTIGDRVSLLIKETAMNETRNFPLPNSLDAITSLISSILISVEESYEKGLLSEFYIFHNQSKPETVYTPTVKRLLPFDEKWRQDLMAHSWPEKMNPEVIGKDKDIIGSLISEYLFVTLYKACAESLASENYSRLGAMQQAEKNIESLLEEISQAYHHLRQSSIDEELFDVVSGFEALKDSSENENKTSGKPN